MFHPETLNMLLSTAAVTLATWMLLRRQFALRWLGLLALTLLAGQLVRASSLFTLAAIASRLPRRACDAVVSPHMPLRQLGIAALPSCSSPSRGTSAGRVAQEPAGALVLFLPRRIGAPADAPFLGLSLDDVFNRPVRPFYKTEILPETYTDIWGDWFGAFAWSGYSAGPVARSARGARRTRARSGSCRRSSRSPAGSASSCSRCADGSTGSHCCRCCSCPSSRVGVYFWRAYVLPSPDGDLTKATYLLTTVPAWAIGFGLAADRLSPARLVAVGIAAAILVFGFLELRFILYGIRDHNPIF